LGQNKKAAMPATMIPAINATIRFLFILMLSMSPGRTVGICHPDNTCHAKLRAEGFCIEMFLPELAIGQPALRIAMPGRQTVMAQLRSGPVHALGQCYSSCGSSKPCHVYNSCNKYSGNTS
jgi:hypothetical protein